MGLADQQVDEPDDGGLVREIAGVGELVVGAINNGAELGIETPDKFQHRLRRRERTSDAIEQIVLGDRDQLKRHPV